MTYFVRSGNAFSVTDRDAINIQEKLPAGNYIVKEHPMTEELYLEKVDNFTTVSKLYGKIDNYAERILVTFDSRPGSTGVMLSGEKGSGKSLLAREICIRAAEEGIPTIVINTPFFGDKFNNFIQVIEQDTVILFDEFEKVYHDTNKQEALLTLLDGAFPTRKLFIMTCNDKYRVDHHMRNRPGRLFYMIDFTGLEKDFIIEYCEDVLVNKEHIPTIVNLSTLFSSFNFDMLKALVEEMNRYEETPQEALAILNAKPEYDKNLPITFEVSIIAPDGTALSRDLYPTAEFKGNPLSMGPFYVYFSSVRVRGGASSHLAVSTRGSALDTNRNSHAQEVNQEHLEILCRYIDLDSDDDFIEFRQEHLVKVDGERGFFEFYNPVSQFRLRLQKVETKAFNYFSHL